MTAKCSSSGVWQRGTVDEGRHKPAVQIAMQAVTLDDEAFDDWAFNRFEATLGPMPTEVQGAVVGASGTAVQPAGTTANA